MHPASTNRFLRLTAEAPEPHSPDDGLVSNSSYRYGRTGADKGGRTRRLRGTIKRRISKAAESGLEMHDSSPLEHDSAFHHERGRSPGVLRGRVDGGVDEA